MGRRAWLDNLLEDKYLPLLGKLQDSPEGCVTNILNSNKLSRWK